MHRPPSHPVYILDEVLSLVGSNRDAIDTATNAIVQRLKARSATVKQKVCACEERRGNAGAHGVATPV